MIFQPDFDSWERLIEHLTKATSNWIFKYHYKMMRLNVTLPRIERTPNCLQEFSLNRLLKAFLKFWAAIYEFNVYYSNSSMPKIFRRERKKLKFYDYELKKFLYWKINVRGLNFKWWGEMTKCWMEFSFRIRWEISISKWSFKVWLNFPPISILISSKLISVNSLTKCFFLKNLVIKRKK